MPYNNQHADYIGNWIQVLKNDYLPFDLKLKGKDWYVPSPIRNRPDRPIFKAAHQAQKALDFITKADFATETPEEAVTSSPS